MSPLSTKTPASLPRLVAVYSGEPQCISHLMDSAALVVGNPKALCGLEVPGHWALGLRMGRDVDCLEIIARLWVLRARRGVHPEDAAMTPFAERICEQCQPKLDGFGIVNSVVTSRAVAGYTYTCRRCGARCCPHFMKTTPSAVERVCKSCAPPENSP
jgi:hypothetical protein